MNETITDPAASLLKEIGIFVGIDHLVFDHEDCCLLELQEKFSFVIRLDRKIQRLVIAAALATPERITEDLFASILSFNALKISSPHPWIALDASTNTFFLAEEFSIFLVEIKEFQERLRLFFEQYLTCQGLLNADTVEALFLKK